MSHRGNGLSTTEAWLEIECKRLGSFISVNCILDYFQLPCFIFISVSEILFRLLLMFSYLCWHITHCCRILSKKIFIMYFFPFCQECVQFELSWNAIHFVFVFFAWWCSAIRYLKNFFVLFYSVPQCFMFQSPDFILLLSRWMCFLFIFFVFFRQHLLTSALF